jgi:1,4-alpha-glucan branching enzyme
VVLVSMIKTMKKTKKAVVKVEASAPEAVKPVTVRREAPQPSRVVLEIVSPDAKQVLVAGSFNEWNPERTPLVAASNGRWTGNLKLGPGQHEYLFVVDGQWLPDPNARESVENPFGGRNSVLKVAG